jgi:hypothetical protein
MTKQEFRRMAITIVAALLTSAASTDGTAATSQQLNCILTDTLVQPGSQSRPVTVVYDEDNKTLTAEAAGRHYSFGKVTITYIAISGQVDDVSLGIDRSSLGIVWQQYGADKVNTEYGHCRPASASD